MMAESIDFYKLEKMLEKKERKIAEDKNLSPRNREIILSYIRASKLGKVVLKGQKRKIGPGRNLETTNKLCKLCEWFDKDLDKVTEEDMERVVLALEEDRIISERDKSYASETKSNFKKFIRKFYKWLFGDNRRYPELVEWIDTSKVEAKIEAIPGLKDGAKEIVDIIPDLRRKALVWVLFDSGFRTSELLNCQMKDIEADEDGIYYISCRFSKTKPRTVSLPYSSELLKRWLDKHPEKDNKDAYLFLSSRVMLYKTVKLYGQKAHQMNITPHMIRHTSATHYAPLLDRATFCKRFGWSYNSPSPDRYIDISKISEQKVIDIVKANQTCELKEDLQTSRIANTALKDKIQRIEGRLEKQNQFLCKMFNAIAFSGMRGDMAETMRRNNLIEELAKLSQ